MHFPILQLWTCNFSTRTVCFRFYFLFVRVCIVCIVWSTCSVSVRCNISILNNENKPRKFIIAAFAIYIKDWIFSEDAECTCCICCLGSTYRYCDWFSAFGYLSNYWKNKKKTKKKRKNDSIDILAVHHWSCFLLHAILKIRLSTCSRLRATYKLNTCQKYRKTKNVFQLLPRTNMVCVRVSWWCTQNTYTNRRHS